MADQIKQIAFKEFTPSEISAGTPWNAIQSGATDAYVIKSIEATQKINTANDAVVATATVGLTSDFNNGKYVSVGNIAKQDKEGSTGNVIVDANSTFTVRPTAKNLTFADDVFHIDAQAATRPDKGHKVVRSSVNGTVDITSTTTTDKTSVTFASETNQYDTSGTIPNNNYTIFHTNANGTNLKLTICHNLYSGVGFNLNNADTGASYGYMTHLTSGNVMAFSKLNFDGQRYIYWYYNNKIYYFDLDESDTNLAAANTMGGGNQHDYYHGYINFTGTPESGSTAPPTSYDHHFGDICEANGKKYMVWFHSGLVSNVQTPTIWIAEIPNSLTNNSTTANTSAKWLILSTNGSGVNDPFGGGSQIPLSTVVGSIQNTNQLGSLHITYDSDLARFLVYLSPAGTDVYVGSFTQAEYDARTNGQAMTTANSTAGAGISTTNQTQMQNNLGFHADYTSVTTNKGRLYLINAGQYGTGVSFTTSYSSDNAWHMKGRTIFFPNQTGGDYHNHIIGTDMAARTREHITSGITGAIDDMGGRMFHASATPTNSAIASRNYPSSPGLTVRISGIHENRS